MLVGALRSALSAKVRDGELTVVNEFSMADHKTKSAAAALKVFPVKRRVLVVDNSSNRNLQLGARNLPGVKVVDSKSMTAYDLLDHDRVLMSEAAARKLSEALAV
jgi:large subunit ribosomal protein L4